MKNGATGRQSGQEGKYGNRGNGRVRQGQRDREGDGEGEVK